MTTTLQSLAGQTVLIIGGTSGIGLSTALQAKAASAHVIVVGSNAERTDKVAHEHGFEGRTADVTRPETIAPALAGIVRVDHLVLLAGSFIVGKVLEADVSLLRRAFDERIWAAVHLLRTLGDRLSEDASVTFVSGAIGERPNAQGVAVIAAAAVSMEVLARGLALEQAPRRFNTLSPGPIDTPILEKSFGDGRAAYVEYLKGLLPLHRLGTPDEAASAVLFLMTNRFMTGATLNVDGGMRLA